VDAGDLYPRALHLSVANLVATRPRDVTLLTLNLDDLLEEALRDALEDLGRDEGVMSRTAAAPRAGSKEHEVHHLHGLVPRDPALPPSGVVLTLSDFNRLGTTAHPWQAGALGEAMTKGPLVIAGTTFRDPDVRQWLHAIDEQLESHGGSVVALVAREGLALSRRQFDAVADSVRQQWNAVSIDALLVQDHSDAAQILRELPAAGSDGYELPRDRAAAHFEEQLEDFSTLQARHSQMLDADRQTLPSQGASESDLTLWLANGSSSLARWTSHDRVYRSPSKLRWVPLGHDSPWAAARAMAQSEVVVVTAQDSHPARRWRTVVAAPITMALPGGPNLVVGALSAATTSSLDVGQETKWRTALADLVETWADRLAPNTM